MGNVVDGMAAADTLLSFSNITPGYCLHYVWQAYAAHGAWSDQSYPTAYSAWLGSSGQHPGDRNPPEGVPVYWGPRSGSSAGDVVISIGNGRVAATDWPYNGRTGTCTLDERERQIGRPYLGWTDNMLGNPILQLQPQPTPQRRRSDDMYVQSDDVPGRVFAVYTDAAGRPRMRLCGQFETAYAVTGDLVVSGLDESLNGLSAEVDGGADGVDTSVRDAVWNARFPVVDVTGKPTDHDNVTSYFLTLTNAQTSQISDLIPPGRK